MLAGPVALGLTFGPVVDGLGFAVVDGVDGRVGAVVGGSVGTVVGAGVVGAVVVVGRVGSGACVVGETVVGAAVGAGAVVLGGISWITPSSAWLETANPVRVTAPIHTPAATRKRAVLLLEGEVGMPK